METKKLRITGAQLSFTVGAIQENKSKILNTLEEAEKINSDIVVFPEMAITGYPISDLLYEDGFINNNKTILDEISSKSSKTANNSFICFDAEFFSRVTA